MTNVQPYDFVKFREELIRRFFNTQSYFFSCFSQQLKNLSSLAKDIEDDDYFLIAQVLEYFKNSENPFHEINKMGEIERIHDFEIFLDETITKLRQPNLPTSEMQDAIKLLAVDLVDTLIEVIHDITTKKQLLQIITGDVELEVSVEADTRVPEKIKENKVVNAHANESDNSDFTLSLPEKVASQRDSLEETDSFMQEKESFLDDIKFDEMGFENTCSDEVDETGDNLELSSFELGDDTFLTENASLAAEPTEENFTDDFLPDLPVTFSEGLVEYDNKPESNEEEQSVPVKEQIAKSSENLIDPFTVPDENLKPKIIHDDVISGKNKEVLQTKTAVKVAEASPRTKRKVPGISNPTLNEPGTLNEGFLKEAKASIAKIQKLVTKLKPEKNVQSVLKELQYAFLDLRESAMIHGFEDIEELAQKSQNLMQHLKVPYRHLSSENIASVFEIISRLKSSMSDDLDEKQQRENEQIIQRMSDFELFIQDQSFHEKESNSAIEYSSDMAKRDFDDNRNVQDEIIPEQIIGAESELEYDAENEDLPDSKYTETLPVEEEDESIQLPGENDDELFKLIKEISEHAVTNRSTTKNKQSTGGHDKEPEKLTIRDEYLESSIEDDAGLISFHAEGELYYRVAFESIESLLKSPNDRIAQENLELAGYSLKGLAKKMGVDVFAHYPQLVEELLAKVLLLKLPCTEKPLSVLKKGFQLYKNTKSKQDLETPEFQKIKREILRFIQSLEDFTQPKKN
ncbi:hypothetical protein KC799_23865 [candidate division KSB1 bacterium]|nr:hypothetical protein [candidate division KSB1 bacterium]